MSRRGNQRSPRGQSSGRPVPVVKTTYESIKECEARIYSILLNFEENMLVSAPSSADKLEKPNDSLYVLTSNDQELRELSENIEKMTFNDDLLDPSVSPSPSLSHMDGLVVEASVGSDSRSESVDVTLQKSQQVIDDLFQHKNDELRKVKDLIEKFRQLKHDQELQFGNSLREIKEVSGLKSLESKLLDREMHILRLKSECEKKEQVLKLMESGLDETENKIREMHEKFEQDKIAKMNQLLQEAEKELTNVKKSAKAIDEDVEFWQQKLKGIMKDAETTEVENIRRKKDKLMAALNKANEDYTTLFNIHTQTLRHLIIIEKNSADKQYQLDKYEKTKEAKKIKLLEQKVSEYQDNIAIKKAKVEEIELYLGISSEQPKQGRGGSNLKTDINISALERKNSKSGVHKFDNKISLELLPDPDDVSAAAQSIKRVRIPLLTADPLVDVEYSATPVCLNQVQSISEIRKIARTVMTTPIDIRNGLVNRSGDIYNNNIKIGSDGNIMCSEKVNSLQALNCLKSILELLKRDNLSIQRGVTESEEKEMALKEVNIQYFVDDSNRHKQLLRIANQHISNFKYNDDDISAIVQRRLSESRKIITELIDTRKSLSQLTATELDGFLLEFRSRLNDEITKSAKEEYNLEQSAKKLKFLSDKWEYLCNSLSETIVDSADHTEISADIQIRSLCSKLNKKQRVAEGWKNRVMEVREGRIDDIMREHSKQITGLVQEFENVLDDEDQSLTVHDLGTIKNEASESRPDSSDSNSTEISSLANEDPVQNVAVMRSTPILENKVFYYDTKRRRTSAIPTSLGTSAIKGIGHHIINVGASHVALESIHIPESSQKTLSIDQQKFEEFKNKLTEDIENSLNNSKDKAIASHISVEKPVKSRITVVNMGRPISKSSDFKRQQDMLHMIGRSKARATNAAQSLRERSQSKSNYLHLQLQYGYNKSLTEATLLEHKNNAAGSYNWNAGDYSHRSVNKPSNAIEEILSLLSTDSRSTQIEQVVGRLVPETHQDSQIEDIDINTLISKLSVDMAQIGIKPDALQEGDLLRQDTDISSSNQITFINNNEIVQLASSTQDFHSPDTWAAAKVTRDDNDDESIFGTDSSVNDLMKDIDNDRFSLALGHKQKKNNKSSIVSYRTLNVSNMKFPIPDQTMLSSSRNQIVKDAHVVSSHVKSQQSQYVVRSVQLPIIQNQVTPKKDNAKNSLIGSALRPVHIENSKDRNIRGDCFDKTEETSKKISTSNDQLILLDFRNKKHLVSSFSDNIIEKGVLTPTKEMENQENQVYLELKARDSVIKEVRIKPHQEAFDKWGVAIDIDSKILESMNDRSLAISDSVKSFENSHGYTPRVPDRDQSTPLGRRICNNTKNDNSDVAVNDKHLQVMSDDAAFLDRDLSVCVGHKTTYFKDEQHRNLDIILADIERKGRDMQVLDVLEDSIGSLETETELKIWEKKLSKLYGAKFRKRSLKLSNDDATVGSASSIRMKKQHNVQIEASLVGYADKARLFDWEKSVYMRRNTVLEVVSDIENQASGGRVGIPPVIALLPKFSEVGSGDINVYNGDETAALGSVQIDADRNYRSKISKNIIKKEVEAKPKQISFKKKSSNSSDLNYLKFVQTDSDGKLTYYFKKPTSLS